MWQIANPWSDGAPKGSKPNDKQYLVAHRKAFLNQMGVTAKTAKSFAETVRSYQPDRFWGSPLHYDGV
jgi:hypothetical protein